MRVVARPGLSIESVATRSLPEPAKVLVLLPPSYDRDTTRRYPVLYFLHDGWGNERTLESNGVAAKLHLLMSEGRLPEFLLVAPGAPGSWFSDSHDGVHRYEEFLTRDLIDEVERRYRVRAEKSARGITGISMGGYGSFKIALKHPDIYGAVSSLSGALIPIEWDDLARYNSFARWTLRRVFGSSRQDNSLAANDVWEILRGLHFDRPPFRRPSARRRPRRVRLERRRRAVRRLSDGARRPGDYRAGTGRPRLGLLAPRDAVHRRVAWPELYI